MRPSAALLTLLLLAGACVPGGEIEGAVLPSGSAAPDDPAPQEASLAQPEVTRVDCPPVEVPEGYPPGLDPSEGVRCGFVIVPEDRGEPTGPVVEVAFTRLAARPPPQTPPAREPLVVLADGPGDSATAEVLAWAASSIRGERDVVLVDSRGAGRSFPSLDCGQPPAPGALPPDLVQDCHRDLLGQGIALEDYDTVTIARDVLDVVDALELARYTLLGVGQGAKVALTVVDLRAEGIESVVLDSPIPHEVDPYAARPAQAQAALNRLFDECAQDAGCDRAFADLRAQVEQTVDQRNAPPLGADEPPAISGDDLVRAAMAAMRGADGPAAVPAALQLAVQDQPEEALARLQAAAVAGPTVPDSVFSEGLLLSSDCQDELPFEPDEIDTDGLGALGLAVAGDVRQVQLACEIWEVARSGGEVNEPVEGDVPLLVLTGEFDPLSSPAWGAAIAARHARSQIVQVDGAGHRVHDADNCTTAIVAEFLRRPTRPLNDACARDRVVDFQLG